MTLPDSVGSQVRQRCREALGLIEQAGGGLTSGGCLDAGSLQRLGSRVRRGPRLGDERRAERELSRTGRGHQCVPCP